MKTNQKVKTLNYIEHFFKTIKTQKRVIYALVLALIAQGSILLVELTKDPLVVNFATKRTFQIAKRKPVTLTKTEVKEFMEDFIKLHYTWDDYNPKEILKHSSPYITKGLSYKLKPLLNSRKKFGDKKISQYVANIQVQLDGGVAKAKFDRILRVGDVPLISVTRVDFTLIQGDVTAMNPYGVYISGVTEYAND